MSLQCSTSAVATLTASQAVMNWLTSSADPGSGDEKVEISKKNLEALISEMFFPTPSEFKPWDKYFSISPTTADSSSPIKKPKKPFTENRSRYSLFPIRDRLAFEFYKKHESIMWSASELHYDVDAKEYPTLPKRYQTIYKQFLAFFAPGDGVITLQAVKFLEDAIRREAPEEECFLLTQLHAEQIHAETYGLAIANVVPESEWDEVFNAIDNLPCVAAKAEFIEKYMYSEDASIGLRYLAGAFAEGTFFTALFALVFFFRRKNNFKTFCSANALIMRDETLHRDYNAAMAKRHGGFSEERAHALAREAVEIEIDHLKFILSEPIDSIEADRASGLTIEAVTDYVKTLADQVLVLSGVSPCFNVNAMLPWMMDIGLPGKENFYETLVTKYSQISVKDAMSMAESSHHDGSSSHHQTAQKETDFVNNPDDVDI